MGVKTVALCLLLSLAITLTLGGLAFAQESSPRSAFFGDIHIHTMYSLDAFMANVRTTPDDAYRFAKGEAIAHPAGKMLRLSGPPLDFLMVSDHAGYLGVFAGFSDPRSPNYNHPAKSQPPPAVQQLIREGSELGGPAVIGDAWQREIEAAERHNDPGKFTTFIGYEYSAWTGPSSARMSPSPGSRHMHRNVVFRSSNVPKLPFSRRDSADPEDLWDWLDQLRAEGIEALAVPHNMNQSDGIAFPLTTWKGGPITKEFAKKRMRNEPIAEITQKKGTSEVHPSLSPNDEWADFQIVQYYLDRVNNKDPISIFKGGYWRDALKTGLEMEAKSGFNPYQQGAIGSSDSHVSAGSYEEDNRFDGRADTPYSRFSAYTPEQGGWDGFYTHRRATHATGGLAGVWAEENTRSSIYDAMRRRETFATSGPRIRVRLFGGFDLRGRLDGSSDAASRAYAHGVPMGGVLSGSFKGAPSLLVWALRDLDAGWLQRVQIVKGWVENGEAQEKIYDVACSDGLEPDPQTHRCPDNGARVDLSDCSISRDKGAVELDAEWTDPSFDPSQLAFYYARVLQNPSCRWSTWDAVRLGIEPNPELAKIIQERAWSSPIWYRPDP